VSPPETEDKENQERINSSHGAGRNKNSAGLILKKSDEEGKRKENNGPDCRRRRAVTQEKGKTKKKTVIAFDLNNISTGMKKA